MQSSHAATAVDVAFDDPNLVADAGLVPVVALAEQIGLPGLVADHVLIVDAANSAGANPAAKVMSLVAGMVAGADSIEDIDRLRHSNHSRGGVIGYPEVSGEGVVECGEDVDVVLAGCAGVGADGQPVVCAG